MSVRRIRDRWWVDITWKGKRYRLCVPDNHRDSALAYELEVKKKLSAGTFVYLATDPRSKIRPASEEFFGTFAPEWFKTYVETYLKPSTQRKYHHALELHLLPRLAKLPLAAITSGAINALAGSLLRARLKPRSVNCIVSVLRRCLDTAVQWGRLEHTPRVQWLKSEPPPFDFLSSAESKRLLAASTEAPFGLMIRMALRTGMRLGELLAVRWEDVDLEQRLITVRRSLVRSIESSPKSHRHRYIPIATDLLEELIAVRESSGYVFSSGGRPLREPRRGLWRALEAAGLRRVGWHVLRHTFASQLASEGVSIYIVQALLGHSTVQMTMRYAHLAPSAMRGVVDVLQEAEERSSDGVGQRTGNGWRLGRDLDTLPGLGSSSTFATPSKKAHADVDSFAGAVGET